MWQTGLANRVAYSRNCEFRMLLDVAQSTQVQSRKYKFEHEFRMMFGNPTHPAGRASRNLRPELLHLPPGVVIRPSRRATERRFHDVSPVNSLAQLYHVSAFVCREQDPGRARTWAIGPGPSRVQVPMSQPGQPDRLLICIPL